MDDRDKLNNLEDAKQFLRKQGLRIDEKIVRKVVAVISGKSMQSLFSLYDTKKGTIRAFCGKGTVIKVQKLYKSDKLKPYLEYIDGLSTDRTVETETQKQIIGGALKQPPVGTQPSSRSSEPTIQKPIRNVATNECPASPANIDVHMLKECGIPANKAPYLLLDWNTSHTKGFHERCIFYKKVFDDVKIRKIPFDKALALSLLESKSIKYNIKSGQRDADIARKYRPWENKDNFSVSFKAMGFGEEPLPPVKKHLDEITNVLSKFKIEVDEIRNKHQWYVTFESQHDAHFSDMLSHCWEIKWEIEKYGQEKQVYGLEIKELISENDIKIPEGVNLDDFQIIHTELIVNHKKDPRVKELVKSQHKMSDRLKLLNDEIISTLKKQEYFRHSAFCKTCSELDDSDI
jgi:hypothetical protein